VVEGDETFSILLQNPTNGATLGTPTTALVTIKDDDIATVDTTAPTVALTSPANATTYTSAQTVTITASASDNVGVSKVELYDGTTLKGTDTTAPYSFAWAITSDNNGSHSLTAKAYDAAGNSKISSAVTMSVNIATTAPNTSGPCWHFLGRKAMRPRPWEAEGRILQPNRLKSFALPTSTTAGPGLYGLQFKPPAHDLWFLTCPAPLPCSPISSSAIRT
jgi:hypothetical protein